MKLSIIIVSYNTKKLLSNCLKSLKPQLTKDIEVIIVDNNSSDDSVNFLKKNYPNIKLIANKENTGFAKANNQGIKQSRGDYILLLNSDTIVQPKALKQITNFMDSHPKVGISSPTLLNPNKTIQPGGGALPRLRNMVTWLWMIKNIPIIGQHVENYQLTNHPNFFKKTRPIGWVAGTAMVLRRPMLDQIGLLDPKIFMYGEDTDLCIRAHKANWQIYTLAKPKIIHLNHGSGSKEKAILGEYNSILYLFAKHKPAWEMPIIRVLLKSGALLRMIIFGKIQRNKQLYEIYRQAYQLA